MPRAFFSLLATFFLLLGATTASAGEEEAAMPRVPVTLSSGTTLEVDPSQAFAALKKRGITTFGKLVAADPAALGSSLASEVTGLGASAGPSLGAVLISSANRSVADRSAGKTVKLGSIQGESYNQVLKGLAGGFGLPATKLTAGHVSVLLNPSRTYRAIAPK